MQEFYKALWAFARMLIWPGRGISMILVAHCPPRSGQKAVFSEGAVANEKKSFRWLWEEHRQDWCCVRAREAIHTSQGLECLTQFIYFRCSLTHFIQRNSTLEWLLMIFLISNNHLKNWKAFIQAYWLSKNDLADQFV